MNALAADTFNNVDMAIARIDFQNNIFNAQLIHFLGSLFAYETQLESQSKSIDVDMVDVKAKFEALLQQVNSCFLAIGADDTGA